MNLKESKQSNCLVAMYLYEMPDLRNLSECLYSLAEQTKPIDLVIYTHGLTDEQIEQVKSNATNPSYTLIHREENGELREELIKSTKVLNVSHIVSESALSFAKIYNKTFNLAIDNGYEFMSLIEGEDSVSTKWFDIAQKYSEENSNIGIFLPLMRNSINGTVTGFLNEAAWAEGMSEEAGKIDVNLLLKYNCVNPLGAVYRVSNIAEYSECEKDESDKAIQGSYKPMKESMKITHYYEFFLRMVYNDVKVLTVSRLCYELKIVRKEIFTDSTCKLPQDITSYPVERGGISNEEGRFWFELAKKEYFFDEDRKKAYEPVAQ